MKALSLWSATLQPYPSSVPGGSLAGVVSFCARDQVVPDRTNTYTETS
jgi:hypothetical protein